MNQKIGKMSCFFRMFKTNLGIAQLPLMIGLLIMAIAVPVATKLVQENTENRGRAAHCVAGNLGTACQGANGKTCQLYRNADCSTSCTANCDIGLNPVTPGPGNATSTPKAQPTSATCPVQLVTSCMNGCEMYNGNWRCKPTSGAPTPTSTLQLCQWKTCEGGTCVSKTSQISWSQTCPKSNCDACGGLALTPTTVPPTQGYCDGNCQPACLVGQYEHTGYRCSISINKCCKANVPTPAGNKCPVNCKLGACGVGEYEHGGLTCGSSAGKCCLPTVPTPVGNMCPVNCKNLFCGIGEYEKSGMTCPSGSSGKCCLPNTIAPTATPAANQCPVNCKLGVCGVGEYEHSGLTCGTSMGKCCLPTVPTPAGNKCPVNCKLGACGVGEYEHGGLTCGTSAGKCCLPTVPTPAGNKCPVGCKLGACGLGEYEHSGLTCGTSAGKCCLPTVPTPAGNKCPVGCKLGACGLGEYEHSGLTCGTSAGKCCLPTVPTPAGNKCPVNCKLVACGIGEYENSSLTCGSSLGRCCLPKTTTPTATPTTNNCIGIARAEGCPCDTPTHCKSGKCVSGKCVAVTPTPSNCAPEGAACYQQSCCGAGKTLYCGEDRKCHSYITSTPGLTVYWECNGNTGYCEANANFRGYAKASDCMSRCSKSGATPTTGGGGGGTQPTPTTGGGGGGTQPTNGPSPTGALCGGKPKPADNCDVNNHRLHINPSCVNGNWDYDIALCDSTSLTGAGERIESCGGTRYCCNKGVTANWTTDLSKCPGVNKCTACAGHPEWKRNGDANCDGETDINDIAVWRVEFLEGGLGDTSRTTWKADFNCDGLVDINDAALWRQKFILTL